MVRILYDPEQLASVSGDQTISNISGYVRAYSSLLTVLQNKQDLLLVVSHQAVQQWLKNMASRYPQGTFDFEILDARQAIAQKWGCHCQMMSVTKRSWKVAC